MAELKTYKAKVLKILEKHESARNNDGSLMAYYIKYHLPNLVTDIPDFPDSIPAVPLKNFQYLPPFESIRRVRVIIQNVDGLCPPTDPEVAEARKIKEKNMRECEVREAAGV